MTAPKGAQTTSSGRTYPVQGRNLPSVNTVLGAMHKPGLEVWKQKKIAVAVATDEDIRAMVLSGSEYRAIRAVLDTEGEEARLGTEVHLWTELYDTGQSMDECPDDIRPFVDGWAGLRQDFALECTIVERTVAHPALGYAGTMDRAVKSTDPELAEVIHPGCSLPHVLDIKSGASVYGSTALQLVAYAWGSHLWDPDTDTLEPMPAVCHELGLIAHLRPERARLYPVDLTQAMAGFTGSLELTRWLQHEREALGEPLEPLTGSLPW